MWLAVALVVNIIASEDKLELFLAVPCSAAGLLLNLFSSAGSARLLTQGSDHNEQWPVAVPDLVPISM